MNSLFKIKKVKTTSLPSSLPNMSLFGNEVRNYEVIYTDKPHVFSNKNDINIPLWLVTTNEMDRQMVVQAGIFTKILYAGMKFVNKNSRLLYLAQMLNGFKYATIRVDNTLDQLGGSSRYYELRRVVDKYSRDNDIDETTAEKKALSSDDLYFYSMFKKYRKGWKNIGAVIPDETDIELKIYRAVRELYQHKSIEKFYFKLLNDFGLYDMRYGRYHLIEKNKIDNIVRSLLPYDIPFEVANEDANAIQNIIDRVKDTVVEAQDYVGNYNSSSYVYRFDKEVGHSRYFDVKLSLKQKRYRLNKTYNILAGKDGWYSRRRLEQVRATSLPSQQYKPQDTLADDIDDVDGLTLPKSIDNKTAEMIMKDADSNHSRHFVDHRTDEGAVHGVAKVHRFNPNKKVHKAIRELRKRNNDSGVVPKNMHRLTTDRKVFQSRKTVAGGSMMIDCSGSMGFSSDDVQEIVDLLPASWIAGYVGYGNDLDGYDGDVRIIADNGRIDTNAIDELTNYGNNSIDFEALKLLAQKPEPRIWVSDQQVLGVMDSGNRRVASLGSEKLKEIERFVLLNNIIPIEDIEMVKKVAKQLSVKR